MRLKTIIALCLLSIAVCAQKAPKGKLLYYSHTSMNPEIPVDQEFSLTWEDGKGELKIYARLNDLVSNYTHEASEDVFHQVSKFIKAKKLYAKGKKPKKLLEPIDDPGLESYTLKYEDKYISFNVKDIRVEKQDAFAELERFIEDIVKDIQPPTGGLEECSITTSSPVPGMGDSYKYLSVRKNEAPVLVIGKRTSTPDGDKEKKYIVSAEDVRELQELILNEKLYKMSGCDSEIQGDYPVTRIFLKYDDGKVYSTRFQIALRDAARAQTEISDFFTSLTKKYKPIEQ